ncbi:MAG: hypothetical protein ACFE0I_15495 [Elainellaceae cyanobacterium]
MSQNFDEFHSRQDGEASEETLLLLGQSQPKDRLLLLLAITIALFALVLGIGQIQENPGLALYCIALMASLGWLAYRLHRGILYVKSDCLAIPCKQLHRGNTYTVVYILQLHDQNVDPNELTATATVQCLQNSVHHSPKTVRTTLSHGASQRRIVNFRKRAQETLYKELVLAQTMVRKQPKVQVPFAIQIPKWLPSSGGFGQYPTLQGNVQWIMDVEVKKQRKQHRTSFLLEVGAPKAE